MWRGETVCELCKDYNKCGIKRRRSKNEWMNDGLLVRYMYKYEWILTCRCPKISTNWPRLEEEENENEKSKMQKSEELKKRGRRCKCKCKCKCQMTTWLRSSSDGVSSMMSSPDWGTGLASASRGRKRRPKRASPSWQRSHRMEVPKFSRASGPYFDAPPAPQSNPL